MLEASGGLALQTVLTIGASSLSWSLFDASRKKMATRFSAGNAVFWLMLFQAPLFLSLLAIESWSAPSSTYWLPAGISLALNVLSNLWFVEAVRLAPLSLVVPILSLTPVFSSIGGFFVLGEATSLRGACGILVIVGATLFLGVASSRQAGDHLSGVKVRRGMLLMGMVALLFALTPVFDKICLQSMPMSEHAFLQCLAVALVMAIWIRAGARMRGGFQIHQLKTSWIWLLVAVIFAALALGAQFLAIRTVPVGIFEAFKRSLGLIFSVGLGFLVFSERVTVLKIAVIISIAIGIFLLLS